MNKKTLIAGLVLFAGAPVMGQVSDVDPKSRAEVARRTATINLEAIGAPVAGPNPIDMGAVVYWGSARNLFGPHQIHAFDAAGVLGVSIDQVPGAQVSAWGYRDGMSDGTSLFFGWDGGVARHDADGTNATQIIFGAAPGGVGTYRALAHDPTGDGGRGSFWVASFASPLAETTMQGGLIQSFPNIDGWSLYGLSYDDTDGNLWGHTTLGDIIKIDTSTGFIMFNPDPGWFTGFTLLDAQGGLSGFSELGGNLAAVSQSGTVGNPDEFGVYDTAASTGGTGVFILGPIDMQTQTGSNGHLGVAVMAPSACPCACDFDPDPACNIFDFLEFQTAFVNGDPCACEIDPDPACNIFDFLQFQTQFVQGCP